MRLPFVLSATISARPKVGQLRICQNCPSSAQCTSVYISIRVCTYTNKRKYQNCPSRVHLCSVYTNKYCIRQNCPWRVQACIRTDVYVKTAPISLGNFFVPCPRSPGHPHPSTTGVYDVENFLRGPILYVSWTIIILKIEALLWACEEFLVLLNCKKGRVLFWPILKRNTFVLMEYGTKSTEILCEMTIYLIGNVVTREY